MEWIYSNITVYNVYINKEVYLGLAIFLNNSGARINLSRVFTICKNFGRLFRSFCQLSNIRWYIASGHSWKKKNKDKAYSLHREHMPARLPTQPVCKWAPPNRKQPYDRHQNSLITVYPISNIIFGPNIILVSSVEPNQTAWIYRWFRSRLVIYIKVVYCMEQLSCNLDNQRRLKHQQSL